MFISHGVFVEYYVHYKKQPGSKYCHDMVRNVLYDTFWRVMISAKNETPISTDISQLFEKNKSTSRPIDVMEPRLVGSFLIIMVVITLLLGYFNLSPIKILLF